MHRFKFTIVLAAALAIFFVVAELGGHANSRGMVVVLPGGDASGDWLAAAYHRLYYWVLASRYIAIGASFCGLYGAAIGLFVDWLRNQDEHKI